MSDTVEALGGLLEGFIPTYLNAKLSQRQREQQQQQKASAAAANTRFKTALELAQSLKLNEPIANYVQTGDPNSLYSGLTPGAVIDTARKSAAAEANADIFKALLQGDQYDAAAQQGLNTGMAPNVAGKIGPNQKERSQIASIDELTRNRQEESKVKAQRLLNLQQAFQIGEQNLAAAKARLDKLNDDAVRAFGIGGMRQDNIKGLVSEFNTMDVFLARQQADYEEQLKGFGESVIESLANDGTPDPELAAAKQAIEVKIAEIKREREYGKQMLNTIMGLRGQQVGAVPDTFKKKAIAFLQANGQPVSDEAIRRVFRHPQHRSIVENIPEQIDTQQMIGPLRPDGSF